MGPCILYWNYPITLNITAYNRLVIGLVSQWLATMGNASITCAPSGPSFDGIYIRSVLDPLRSLPHIAMFNFMNSL